MRVQSPKDVFTGLVFGGFALAFLWKARDYPLGSALAMGPAYFPDLTAALLLLIGFVLILRGFKVEGERGPLIHVRTLALVVGSVVVFGILVEGFGLIPAAVATIVMSSMAGESFRIREILGLVLVLVIGAVLIFQTALGVPFKLIGLP